jgi:acyl-coenzyme A synthetase/AMP-(fatty) acid ligase
MKMPQNDVHSLWDALTSTAHGSDRAIWAADSHVTLNDLSRGSSLDVRLDELRGRSVLIFTRSQLTAALALIQIDGIARRIVLCPPDLDAEHVPFVMATADVDAIVFDEPSTKFNTSSNARFVQCSRIISLAADVRGQQQPTEWVLFTSGTSGAPKMVSHSLSSLAGSIKRDGPLGGAVVWSTFYDIRRYGGLQIFLRALLGGGSLVLSSTGESTADFLVRAGSHSVTHITGTPSHWRRALMSGATHRIAPEYVRLSGEIADQIILDSLKQTYPRARIAHAFASTEAGVGFEVEDGLAGIPTSQFLQAGGGVEMKVEDGSLRIRSTRAALRYIGSQGMTLVDQDGYVDTGDILEFKNGRYYFVGRRGGIINVGGLKIHPEEVEAVINRHPRVQMSLVKSRKSPVTGSIVVADIVLKPAPRASDARDAGAADEALKSEILANCQHALAAHKVPAAIRIVPFLEVTPSGKVARPGA